jgi:hypothetical protein
VVEGIDDLPKWVQTVLTAGAFFGTVAVAVLGYFKKWFEPSDKDGPTALLTAVQDLRRAVERLDDSLRTNNNQNVDLIRAVDRLGEEISEDRRHRRLAAARHARQARTGSAEGK